MKTKFLLCMAVLILTSIVAYAQQSVYFDGTGDYITLGSNQLNQGMNGATGLTLEAWVYPTALRNSGDTQRNVIADFCLSGSFSMVMLYLRENGKIRFGGRSQSADSFQNVVTANVEVAINGWYHIAGVLDYTNKAIYLYVNGSLVASQTTGVSFGSNTYTSSGGSQEFIGVNQGLSAQQYYQGYIDNMRIWSTPRTQDDIQQQMYADTPEQTYLLGFWKLEGTANDSSGTPTYNGTLMGDAAFQNTGIVLTSFPTTQASGLNATNIGVNSLTVNWDNGNGARRIVVMNTENTFTNPVNGTDPSANSVWQNSGQQVIYNGTGSSVPISGLDPGTKYWFRVYEYNGTGIYTVYLKTTAVNNPIESDETLPIELSSFTANFTVNNLVVLHWITQSETECQGYYILRNTSNDLSSAQIISQLIPAHNTSDQQVYTYNDTEVFESGMYYYWLQDMDFNGGYSYHGPLTVNVGYTPGDDPIPGIPFVAGIKKIYPNPATINTIIKYGVEESNEVQFEIYNSKGQLVRSFNQGIKDQGDFSLIWNGKDSKGSLCPSGIYLVRMQAGKLVSSSKLMLVR